MVTRTVDTCAAGREDRELVAGEAVFHPALVSPPYSDSQGNANTSTGGYPSPDGVNNPQPSWSWWRAGPHAYKPTYLHCFGINAEWPGVSSDHPSGAMFGYCDGSVHFLGEARLSGWVRCRIEARAYGEPQHEAWCGNRHDPVIVKV